MHVCIDYRPALHQSTGVGTYVHGLVNALACSHPDDRFSVYTSSWRHRNRARFSSPNVVKIDRRFPVRIVDNLWHRFRWPPIELLAGTVDIAHSPSPMLLPTRSARQVVTVHDCHFLRHPEDVSGPVRRDYVPRAQAAVLAADAVLTPSETTADEVERLFGVAPERIHVTPLGIDSAYLESGVGGDDVETVLTNLGVRQPYLLFVGCREPRKDLGTLLGAFELLVSDIPDLDLVLVGPEGPGWGSVWQATPEIVRQRIRCLQHQLAGPLSRLYSGAEALLLSSLWEGFGLTAIEAMACNTPVIAAKVGALPETLGDVPLWFEPRDPDGLAGACRRLLDDSSLGEQLRARGHQRAARYRWERTAALTHEVYRQLLD